MIICNFSHPLTPAQLRQIEILAGHPITEVRDVPASFDNEQPFEPQVSALVDAVGLAPADWQTLAIFINPPAYNFAAAVLMAELHGRMGYFPTILRLRPVFDSIPSRFEVAEIISLQQVRAQARLKRY